MATVSLRALARALGVTLKSVQKARDSGRIKPEKGGGWNVAKVRRQWDGNTMHEKRHRGGVRSTERKRTRGGGTPPARSQQVSEGEEGSLGRALNKARMESETIRTRMLQLEYDERRGELVLAEEVKNAAFRSARRARDLLLALPPQLGPILVGLTPQEATQVLEEELGKVCDELAASAAKNGAGRKRG